MSIAALADIRLQRTEANPSTATPDAPKTTAGVPVGVINTLVQWVPTETLATYVAVQAIMPAVDLSKVKSATEADYGSRWLLFWVMLVFTAVLVPIYAKIKTNASSSKFEWPLLEMGISIAAFTLWVVALADSPFATYGWYESYIAVLAIVAGGGLLGALTVALKASPDWAQGSGNNAPPSPDVR